MNILLRLFLFLSVCIPIRLYLAYIPQVLDKRYFLYFAVMIGLMGIGTLILAFTNSRLNAPEGGGKTWWASYRFIHGMLLMTAFIYLIKGDKNASIPLLLDVMVGITLFFISRLGIV
jgi:hypothetical protein